MVKIRRRGVAIVEFEKGILVVSTKGKDFMLPGGGANRWESRKKATIRELYEETGLKTKEIKYFFKYKGKTWHNHQGILVKNYTKVFIVKAMGIPKPHNEIKHIKFWKPKSKIFLSSGSKNILERYVSKNIKTPFPFSLDEKEGDCS